MIDSVRYIHPIKASICVIYDSYNAKIRIFSECSKSISQNLLEGTVVFYTLKRK